MDNNYMTRRYILFRLLRRFVSFSQKSTPHAEHDSAYNLPLLWNKLVVMCLFIWESYYVTYDE